MRSRPTAIDHTSQTSTIDCLVTNRNYNRGRQGQAALGSLTAQRSISASLEFADRLLSGGALRRSRVPSRATDALRIESTSQPQIPDGSLEWGVAE